MNPKKQNNQFHSPWPIWVPVLLAFWKFTWIILCSWNPKFLNHWRLAIMRLFGTKIFGTPFVHPKARIQIPWHLTMHHRACLGERANVYSLGEIEIFEGATVSQESYLCAGSHDISDKNFRLITNRISIGANSFLGVRSMVLPGVKIGENAVVGAQAVVTKDIAQDDIVAGNPAQSIGKRIIS